MQFYFIDVFAKPYLCRLDWNQYFRIFGSQNSLVQHFLDYISFRFEEFSITDMAQSSIEEKPLLSSQTEMTLKQHLQETIGSTTNPNEDEKSSTNTFTSGELLETSANR